MSGLEVPIMKPYDAIRRNGPNLLSALRLAMVPSLATLAWFGEARLFLTGLVVALLTDGADGFLARRGNRTSVLGAKLDSWADLALFASVPISAWWLWPDVIRAEARFILAAVAAYTVPIGVGLLKFRRLTSYHTWGAKLSAVLMGGSALLLFTDGPTWPFHLATLVLVLEAVEEIAITTVLPRWTSDVRSLGRALDLARSES